MGVNFFLAKLDTKGGGGSEGFVSVDAKKSQSSFLNISLTHCIHFAQFNPFQILN